MNHAAFTLQRHHTRLSPRKHLPDGAIMASGSNHLITAYYSLTILIYRLQEDERLS